jgi:RNA polymerase sigma-70 factor (ECF subfamily)
VKGSAGTRHYEGGQPWTTLPVPDVARKQEADGTAGAAAPDIVALHAAYAPFVWKALQRLGVRTADLDDMLQEVFVVIHRRQDDYRAIENARAWLYAICVRVAAHYRRRAYLRRERPGEAAAEPIDARASASPEEVAAARQTRARLQALLDRMEIGRRAVLVMFEIDHMSCDEIAAEIGVPVGTVYSRLHAARKELQKLLARQAARERGRWP